MANQRSLFFGTNLQIFMRINKCRNIELANRTGISQGRIASYRNGKFAPSCKELGKIINALPKGDARILFTTRTIQTQEKKEFKLPEWSRSE